MDFTKNIPKYKPKLLSLLLTLAIAVTTFIQYPITAYAAVDYDSLASALVDSTGDDSYGGTEKVVNGATVYRTGYLCYMLTVDGATVPGTQAYAFKSPGYVGNLSGSTWICESRQGGYSASTWSGTAPWELTPWQAPPKGSKECVTNEPQIKAWFEGSLDGVQNGVNFVDTIWGEEVAQKFINDEYILVIETIMNFQYSISNSSATVNYYSLARDIVDSVGDADDLVFWADGHGYDNCFDYYYGELTTDEERADFIKDLKDGLIRAVAAQLEAKGLGGKYTLVGQPIIANVPNLIRYKQSLGQPQTALDSYTNKVAPISERILPGGPGERAGFVAWTGSTSSKLSNDDVINYGVGMIVVTAKSDAIHTYWPSNGAPGDPEPSLPNKTGKCNIVKCYYNENLTTHVKTDLGTFTRKDCTNKIIISGEPGFELVEWRVTNQTDLSHNSLTWSPPGSTSQSGKLGKTVTLKEPETCVYVLLRKVEEEEVKEEDYNYIIKESQITRRVYFSFPDEDTAKYKDSPQSNMNSPYIYEHEFRWLSPKVPICKGHTYMDDCPWHDPGCNENCLEDCDIDHSFQHDYDCVEATAYCKDPDWEEKSLLLSINNTLQEDYQNVLVPQATWNREVELEKETKHYYKDDQPFDREVLEDIEWHPKSGGYPNWDYI